MAVFRLREAAEETGTGKSTRRAIESGCMSAELTEDGGTPNVSLPQLPAPETIATHDLAAKLAAADAAILKRDRDEWRGRAERFTERPWWRRLAG